MFDDGEIATRVAREAFDRRLLVETAGPDDRVIKLLPPLTIPRHALELGLAILGEAVAAVARRRSREVVSA